MKGDKEMDRLRLQNESGFTLIELLVVVAIIGILAAIAIPQFSAYRKRGYEAQVRSDLRNAATAQEAYFASKQPSVYTNCGGDACVAADLPGFNPTAGVTVEADPDTDSFTLTATHAQCSTNEWTFSSTTGQITGSACP
jgi:prepilin-type N-terminal cleavage/methylation domain-containing protein